MLSMALINAGADTVTEENKLLKSWGLKFNARGFLKFRRELPVHSEYRPWNPDIPAYKLEDSNRIGHNAMPPLVISAKQKSEK